MSLQISYEVTDRNEMEGIPGLHATLQFKDEQHRESHELVGVVTLSDEMAIASVEVTKNGLHLNDDLAKQLIREACASCWNDIVVNGMVGAGVFWRSFDDWLSSAKLPLPDHTEDAVRTAIVSKRISLNSVNSGLEE